MNHIDTLREALKKLIKALDEGDSTLGKRIEQSRAALAATAKPVCSRGRKGPDEGGSGCYGYDECAMPAPTAQQQAVPDFWWNGLRKDDDREASGPSFSEYENTHHDIPLYSGINPATLAAQQQEKP